MTNEISTLIRRCKLIGIELEVWINAPWIYLESVNSNKVQEKCHSEHKFTMGWTGTRIGESPHLISERHRVFEIIRKYK